MLFLSGLNQLANKYIYTPEINLNHNCIAASVKGGVLTRSDSQKVVL
jgi:hypothetical protein